MCRFVMITSLRTSLVVLTLVEEIRHHENSKLQFFFSVCVVHSVAVVKCVSMCVCVPAAVHVMCVVNISS